MNLKWSVPKLRPILHRCHPAAMNMPSSRLMLALIASLGASVANAGVAVGELAGSEVEFEGLVQTDGYWYDNDLSNIDAGDHVSYAPISLSQVPKLRFRVASAGAGGTIEARLDSPTGELAGSVDVPVTGGWQQWQFVDMDVAASAQEGSHELFLVFTNPNPAATGLFNINFFDAAGKGVSVNSKPQVGAEGTPTQGTAPLTVDFTGSASDFDGDELTYEWDFGVPGDSDTATSLDAEYTYTEPGTYSARLTATDTAGATGNATVPVRVLNACGVQQTDEYDGT